MAEAPDAFDIVIPSLPGYGFSMKPTELGWGSANRRRGSVWLYQRPYWSNGNDKLADSVGRAI